MPNASLRSPGRSSSESFEGDREGGKQVEAAQLFGVTRQAVGKWVKKYREGGARALRAGKRGRPSKSSLLPWQAAQIAKAVVHRILSN